MQARGPLSALRTLGSILVPRLRQKEGQEIDREMAQGILTQVCPFSSLRSTVTQDLTEGQACMQHATAHVCNCLQSIRDAVPASTVACCLNSCLLPQLLLHGV